jgi:hypothetical protein
MKNALHPILLFAAALGLALESTAPAQDVMNIVSPLSAPIYVLEGHFAQSFDSAVSNGKYHADIDADETMDINTGGVNAVGDISVTGTAYTPYGLVPFKLSTNLAIKGVVKQAGNAIRWSGKSAVDGLGSLYQGSVPFSFSTTLQYRNMLFDPGTGEQSGQLSFSGSAKAYGVKMSIKQEPINTLVTKLENFGISGLFNDCSGRWSLSVIPTIDYKGRATGMSQLTIGDPSDPYASVFQKLGGKLNDNAGVVGITGVGINKSTSKVKILLNYWQATGELVPNKNWISAYGQTQRF